MWLIWSDHSCNGLSVLSIIITSFLSCRWSHSPPHVPLFLLVQNWWLYFVRNVWRWWKVYTLVISMWLKSFKSIECCLVRTSPASSNVHEMYMSPKTVHIWEQDISPGISLINNWRGVGILFIMLDCRWGNCLPFTNFNTCRGLRASSLLPNSCCRGVRFKFLSRAFRPSLSESIASAVALDKIHVCSYVGMYPGNMLRDIH